MLEKLIFRNPGDFGAELLKVLGGAFLSRFPSQLARSV